MCNSECLSFVGESLSRSDVQGKRVLEVGSLDVNGSPRTVLEPWEPSDYAGVDIKDGPRG